MGNEIRLPNVDEYVIVTVTGINPNSAFVTLDEYGGITGMIHVSEVANTWVRDIKQFVSQGQKLVLKVIAIDMERGHINLSLKRVKPSARREKLNEYKNDKKASSLLNFVQKDLGASASEREQIETKIKEKFGLLYGAFEVASVEGSKALIDEGLEKNWAEKITEVAKKNIKEKEVELKGMLDIKSFEWDGIETIKNALSSVPQQMEIKYIGAPHYKVVVKAKDYPEGEKILSTTINNISSALKGKGEVVFNRE